MIKRMTYIGTFSLAVRAALFGSFRPKVVRLGAQSNVVDRQHESDDNTTQSLVEARLLP